MSGSPNLVLDGRLPSRPDLSRFANRQRQSLANLTSQRMVRCHSDLSLTAATVRVGTPETNFRPLETWLWMVRCHRHPSSRRFSKETTPVPCQSARNHTISDPPQSPLTAQNMISSPQKSVLDGFCHLDLIQKVLQTSSGHSYSCSRPFLFLFSKQQQQPQMTPENTISGTQNVLLDGP